MNEQNTVWILLCNGYPIRVWIDKPTKKDLVGYIKGFPITETCADILLQGYESNPFNNFHELRCMEIHPNIVDNDTAVEYDGDN